MIPAYRHFPTTLRAFSLLMAALAMLFASTAALAQTMASSVSQHGITWYFDQEHEVGQYANGDWWVLGPVTITRITPESAQVDGRWQNGTQVNPAADGNRQTHGYDERAHASSYNDTLNVDPGRTGEPLSLSTGSVVKAISFYPLPDGYHSSGTRINDLAILTVVESVPPAGAFRPAPWAGSKESHWVEGQLDYGILQNLQPVENTPNLAERSERMLRFWNEQFAGTWTQTAVKARNNQPGYGSNQAQELGDNALLLHHNFSKEEKRDLFVGMVQYGLDIYQRILVGGRWWSDGGWNHGRKYPMLLAGIALNDSDILYQADREKGGRNLFQEDGSTFVVNQAQIDLDDDRCGSYTQEHLGLPEWSTRYWADYDEETGISMRSDGNRCPYAAWSTPYRYVGNQYVTHALAARLTSGAHAAWNWQPFFDYADRVVEKGGLSGYGLTAFGRNMWSAYRHSDHSSGMDMAAPSAPVLFVD